MPVTQTVGANVAHSAPSYAAAFTSSCQFQTVEALSFSATACNTATAGAVVLLKFTVGTPPVCFQGSILAAAPAAELLQDCPRMCRLTADAPVRALPVPQPGLAVGAGGKYMCQDGVYSYGWQVPGQAGCYRLSITMADRSSVVALLRILDAAGGQMVTQADDL